MREGWHSDEYLVLFDEPEMSLAYDRYEIGLMLSGFAIVGLRGWDEFIVRKTDGATFTVPTVPLDSKYLKPIALAFDLVSLIPDPQLSGKIKWYVTPLVFGGDPISEENQMWVTHSQHADLVRWWNNQYRELRRTEKNR